MGTAPWPAEQHASFFSAALKRELEPVDRLAATGVEVVRIKRKTLDKLQVARDQALARHPETRRRYDGFSWKGVELRVS